MCRLRGSSQSLHRARHGSKYPKANVCRGGESIAAPEEQIFALQAPVFEDAGHRSERVSPQQRKQHGFAHEARRNVSQTTTRGLAVPRCSADMTKQPLRNPRASSSGAPLDQLLMFGSHSRDHSGVSGGPPQIATGAEPEFDMAAMRLPSPGNLTGSTTSKVRGQGCAYALLCRRCHLRRERAPAGSIFGVSVCAKCRSPRARMAERWSRPVAVPTASCHAATTVSLHSTEPAGRIPCGQHVCHKHGIIISCARRDRELAARPRVSTHMKHVGSVCVCVN